MTADNNNYDNYYYYNSVGLQTSAIVFKNHSPDKVNYFEEVNRIYLRSYWTVI